MANSITLPDSYVMALDLMYKRGALTSLLDNALAKAEGHTFKIKKVSVQGPGSMGANGAFVGGDVTVAWQSVTPDYDRGRKFTIEATNEAEVGGLYMDVAAEFERTMSIPEIDAYRFAKYTAGAGTTVAADLADATALLTALNVAAGLLDTNEVPIEGRIAYVEAAKLRAIQALDTTKSRETLASFAQVVPVPQGRFYSAITLYDGSTAGQEAGSFIKNATTGKNLNFLIVHPTAVTQAMKRVVSPVDVPDADYDAFRVGNRKYGYCAVHDNKTKGIYAHTAA